MHYIIMSKTVNMKKFRKYILVAEDEFNEVCPPQNPVISSEIHKTEPLYHDYNQNIPSADEKHVRLLEQQMIASKQLPLDVQTKLANASIKELLTLNKDIKEGPRAPPPLNSPVESKISNESDNYVTSKLKQYSSATQYKQAKEIINYLTENRDKYNIDLQTGRFSIHGKPQSDSIIDVALALTAPSKSKKHATTNLKNWDRVARNLYKADFPAFMITHNGAKRRYSRLMDNNQPSLSPIKMINWS